MPKETAENNRTSKAGPEKIREASEEVVEEKAPKNRLKDPYEKRHIVNPDLTKELPIIKVKNLTKRFGKHVILKDINLDIKRGEIFGIVGESGGGKTTFLKTLVGFLLPDSGTIQFEQRDTMKDVHKNSNDSKRFFGFAAQEPSFYLRLKVNENIEHFGALYGLTKEERQQNAERLLKLVNLHPSKNSLAIKLSGGMRRRLGLLTATIHKPEIYVLDEPTADLDPYSRKLVINFIKHVNEQGKTVIIASHLLEDIENLCDRVGIMYNNNITRIGTPDELKTLYAKHKLVEIQTKPKKYDKIMEKIKNKSLKLTDMFVENKKLYIKSEETEALLSSLLGIIKECGQELVDINISRPNLSEIFEELGKE